MDDHCATWPGAHPQYLSRRTRGRISRRRLVDQALTQLAWREFVDLDLQADLPRLVVAAAWLAKVVELRPLVVAEL